MDPLRMALVSAVSTVIIATRPLTTTYQCGPFCPPENVTMKSC
ncbi:hypothetical protein MRX96_049924, partial [Rhipicephalus microplus]